jgi:hypothetical protein
MQIRADPGEESEFSYQEVYLAARSGDHSNW